jgi:hypothetical protein
LDEVDREVHDAISAELARQESTLEIIASENFAPLAVMQAQGSVLTNKRVVSARSPTSSRRAAPVYGRARTRRSARAGDKVGNEVSPLSQIGGGRLMTTVDSGPVRPGSELPELTSVVLLALDDTGTSYQILVRSSFAQYLARFLLDAAIEHTDA